MFVKTRLPIVSHEDVKEMSQDIAPQNRLDNKTDSTFNITFSKNVIKWLKGRQCVSFSELLGVLISQVMTQTEKRNEDFSDRGEGIFM